MREAGRDKDHAHRESEHDGYDRNSAGKDETRLAGVALALSDEVGMATRLQDGLCGSENRKECGWVCGYFGGIEALCKVVIGYS